MIEVGILGASGYAGADLVRLLSQREDVEIKFLGANRLAGAEMVDYYPNLRGHIDQSFAQIDLDDPDSLADLDILFAALPHKLSQGAIAKAYEAGVKVVDFSADYRLKDPEVYEAWYDTPHEYQDLLAEAVYGLVEINREEIREARIVANPGCFPTAMILGLAPLAKGGYLKGEAPIISDCKTALSGAGRNLKDHLLFSQGNEDVSPYSVGIHRHTPEVEEQLGYLQGDGQPSLLFAPHLVPIQRGLLATMYVTNHQALKEADLQQIYADFYGEEKFVRLLAPGTYPHTKAVAGSNFVDISLHVDDRTKQIVVMTAIDNLIKGAAGQAMQNMNLMLGLPESKGLEQASLWP